jgi:hypothetical protein
MKVLFLDFDGVINTATDFSPGSKPEQPDRWGHDLSLIRPELVARVDEVCRRTGAKVVFSTSWRYGNTPDYLHKLLVTRGLTAGHAGQTPVPQEIAGPGVEGLYRVECRGDEVQGYLDRHPEVEAFAIVDDMGEDAFSGLLDHFVQTSIATGITQDHVERLVIILGETVSHQKAPTLWAISSNQFGLYAPEPILVTHDPETGAYWDEEGEFDVSGEGYLCRYHGVYSFASSDRDQVLKFISDYREVIEHAVNAAEKLGAAEQGSSGTSAALDALSNIFITCG